MRWTLSLVQVLMEGKGVNRLNKQEKEFYHSLSPVYLSNLRRAVLKRLRGFHSLPKLAKRFGILLSDLKQVVRLLFTEEARPLRRRAFFFAISLPEIKPVEHYGELVTMLVKKVISRDRVRSKLGFVIKYDPSLSVDDLVNEAALTVVPAIQKVIGLDSLERVERYAHRSAANAIKNLAKKYSSEKRQRIRESSDPYRQFESVVESLPDNLDRFTHLKVEGIQLTRDPILLKAAYKRIASDPSPFKFRKLKFLQLLLNGHSWAEAVRISDISEASLDTVIKVLINLQREGDEREVLPVRFRPDG